MDSTSKIKARIEGTVIDSITLKPIPYPKIEYFPIYSPSPSNNLTLPDLIELYKSPPVTGEGKKNGKFSIEIPPISEYLNKNGKTSSLILQGSKLEVIITIDNYNIVKKVPLNGDGTFKPNLGVIQLLSLQETKKNSLLKTNEVTEEQMKILQGGDISKGFIELQTENLLNTIKGKLTPFIISQISSLGIADPISLIKEAKKLKNK